MNNLLSLNSEQEIELAKLSSRELAGVIQANDQLQRFTINDESGSAKEVTIPAPVWNFMCDILTELSNGVSIQITPIQKSMTTQEAADFLGMSRPTLIKILDNGEMPYTKTGTRRKVNFADVMEYKENLTIKRKKALLELSALDEEMGLAY